MGRDKLRVKGGGRREGERNGKFFDYLTKRESVGVASELYLFGLGREN